MSKKEEIKLKNYLIKERNWRYCPKNKYFSSPYHSLTFQKLNLKQALTLEKEMVK